MVRCQKEGDGEKSSRSFSLLGLMNVKGILSSFVSKTVGWVAFAKKKVFEKKYR